MKKIWLAVVAVITLAFSIYAIHAGTTVKGIEIYFVSYDEGRVFASTYVIAGILAVAGWICVILQGIKIVRQWWNSKSKKSEIKDIPSDVVQKQEVKCAGCGAVLKADAKFCTQCGKKVE